MKLISLVFIWLAAAASAFASHDATLASLIGREFIIQDDWAGQAFVLTKQGDSIRAVWRIFGSGRPIVSEKEYPVEIQSEKQGVFSVELRGSGTEPRGTRNEVKVRISDEEGVLVYLNGVRIHLRENGAGGRPERG